MRGMSKNYGYDCYSLEMACLEEWLALKANPFNIRWNAAIWWLTLWKFCRKGTVLDYLNGDIAMIIARLVHDTKVDLVNIHWDGVILIGEGDDVEPLVYPMYSRDHNGIIWVIGGMAMFSVSIFSCFLCGRPLYWDRHNGRRECIVHGAYYPMGNFRISCVECKADLDIHAQTTRICKECNPLQWEEYTEWTRHSYNEMDLDPRKLHFREFLGKTIHAPGLSAEYNSVWSSEDVMVYQMEVWPLISYYHNIRHECKRRKIE